MYTDTYYESLTQVTKCMREGTPTDSCDTSHANRAFHQLILTLQI